MKQNAAAWTVIAVSIVMIGIGVWRGEALTVLQKAIMICMECIGIG